MSERQWFEDYQNELKAEQSGKSKDEIKDELKQTSDYVFDLDNAPKQHHRWIDRGLKLSCEGANHPNHQAFKR